MNLLQIFYELLELFFKQISSKIIITFFHFNDLFSFLLFRFLSEIDARMEYSNCFDKMIAISISVEVLRGKTCSSAPEIQGSSRVPPLVNRIV